MTYLQRRVAYLKELLRDQRLLAGPDLSPELWSQLQVDIAAVNTSANGLVDVSTCSPLVRSLARMAFSTREVDWANPGEDEPPPLAPTLSDVRDLQRELFNLLDAFLEEVCGHPPSELADHDEFVAHAKSRAGRGVIDENRLRDPLDRYMRLESRHAGALYSFSKGLAGQKLVVAGPRFLGSTLGAVRSMLLYSDTLLIPDPVVSWLEQPRPEEAFPHVHLAREAFFLSRMRPLIDADLPVPPVLIFPSWEKSLEKKDEVTQDGIACLLLSVLSWAMGESFEDESEVVQFATTHEEAFLERAQERQLLVAPNDKIGNDVRAGLNAYRQFIEQYRAGETREAQLALSDGLLLLRALEERLTPQFHLRENSEMFEGSPLFWLEAQWHYFGLLSEASEASLCERAIMSDKATMPLRAMNDARFRWLGNVPIDALVELRQRDENLEFRKRIAASLEHLSSTAFEDLGRVIAEIGRGLEAGMREHQREIDRICTRYADKYRWEAVAAWATVAASYWPWFGPYLPPFVSGGTLLKYLGDKYAESRELKRASRSLLGVLAAAARQG